MRRLLVRVLEKESYQLTVLASGEELLGAIKGMEPGGEPPDLIVSDVRMPGATAFEALEQLRALELHVPVILITAFCDEATLVRATDLGAACVLSKPFDMDMLRSAVTCVLEGR